MTLPTEAKARKAIPVYSGFVKYFPRAMCAVAELSRVGNDQHNPGQPLHWDKTKSMDHLDCLLRHMIDDVLGVTHDTDEISHKVKVAWRAMADLEITLEKAEQRPAPAATDHHDAGLGSAALPTDAPAPKGCGCTDLV